MFVCLSPSLMYSSPVSDAHHHHDAGNTSTSYKDGNILARPRRSTERNCHPVSANGLESHPKTRQKQIHCPIVHARYFNQVPTILRLPDPTDCAISGFSPNAIANKGVVRKLVIMSLQFQTSITRDRTHVFLLDAARTSGNPRRIAHASAQQTNCYFPYKCLKE